MIQTRNLAIANRPRLSRKLTCDFLLVIMSIILSHDLYVYATDCLFLLFMFSFYLLLNLYMCVCVCVQITLLLTTLLRS